MELNKIVCSNNVKKLSSVAHIYINRFTCLSTDTNTHIHQNTHTPIHIHLHIHKYTHKNTHVHIQMLSLTIEEKHHQTKNTK